LLNSLYLLFAAVPIIYEENRGWNTLVGSLPFLGVLVGTVVAAAINITYSRWRFVPLVEKHGWVEPEHRLPPMMIGQCFFFSKETNGSDTRRRRNNVPDRILLVRLDSLTFYTLVPRSPGLGLHRNVLPSYLPGWYKLPGPASPYLAWLFFAHGLN
jgi:hypothetical protein